MMGVLGAIKIQVRQREADVFVLIRVAKFLENYNCIYCGIKNPRGYGGVMISKSRWLIKIFVTYPYHGAVVLAQIVS